MSRTVDERVVSMKFDNKHFESNVKTSMSTLDKLKQKLNLSGATKGLDNVNKAAKNTNMSGLGSAVETVRTKFSALEVMGVTALANITNSAVNAGKRIVSSLTLEPVMTGFSEYELKMNSLQTILSSTGEELETVNKYLEELNEYSDQTIYSFADMTQNIGKFTNAGVKLDDAVLAIKGISNEAALSGANANEASRAMYNFAQALSVGYVQRIDWKSIELANMATVEFKEQLLDSAIAMGTVKKNSEGMYATLKHSDKFYNSAAMFTETLDDQWLTTEVLINTLKNYSDETTDVGKRAFAAAQDVRTFSQMMNVLKETAQSGWAKTWELIFGDLEEAKKLFTNITNFFSKIINGISDARNKIVETAMSSPFGKIIEQIKTVTGLNDKLVNSVSEVSDKLKDLDTIVDEVIQGKWGNTEKRWNALAEAGYNWATVQNKVNEELDCSVRHNEELAEKQIKVKKSEKGVSEARVKSVEDLLKMNDAQLKEIGLTKKQIKALRELEKAADRAGISVKDAIEDPSLLSGRNLLINSFKNIGTAIIQVVTSIRKAWRDTFDPIFTGDKIYNLIASFHKFTQSLVLSEENVGKLKTTFEGLFAVLDIVLKVVGGPIKIVFKVVSELLKAFDLNILDVTEAVAKAIIKFRDWIEETFNLSGIIEVIVPYVKMAADAIRNFMKSVKESEALKNITAWLKDSADSFKKWIEGIKNADNIPQYILEGLVNGIKSGATAVWNAIVYVAEGLINKVKEILGIHSPSTEMAAIGQFTMEGLWQGIQNGAGKVFEVLKGVFNKLIEIAKNIDLGSILAAGIGAGILITIKNITDVVDKFASVFQGLGDMFSGIGEMFTGIGKNFKAKAFERRTNAILNIAKAVGILALAIILLAKVETADLIKATTALFAIGLLISLMLVIANKVGDVNESLFKTGPILAIGASLLLIAIAMKKLASIDLEDVPTVMALFLTAIGGIIGLMFAFSVLAKGKRAKYVDQVGKMLLKMSVAFLIMGIALKTIGGMDPANLGIGLLVITLLTGMFVGLMAMTKVAGKSADRAGSMLLKMALALAVIGIAIRIIGGIDMATLIIGLTVISLVTGLFVGLIAISKLSGEHASKAGAMLLQMSLALLIIGIAIRSIGSLDPAVITKGIIAITALEALFIGFIAATNKLAGNNAVKIGATLLVMSVSILILAGAIAILSFLDPGKIAVATLAITALGMMFAELIVATGYAKDCKSNLIVLTVAITLLSLALIGLSLLEPAKLAVATAALTAVIGVFSLLVAATKFAKDVKITQLLMMLGVVTVLAGIIVGLSYLPTGAPLESVAALSLLLTSLTGAMMILSNMKGSISKGTLGQLAIILAIVAGIAVILGGLKALNVEPSLGSAAAISLLLASFVVALDALAIIGPKAKLADSAMLPLVKLIGIVGLIVAALGALALIPGFDTFMQGGADILGVIGYAIGNFIGSIIGGLGAGISSGLPAIGENLSAFMTNAKVFIDGVKDLDSSVLDGVKSLAAAILVLSVADFIHGITDLITQGASLAKLGMDLSMFMIAAKPFLTGIKDVDPSTMESAKSLAEVILALTASNLLNGISKALGFGSSMTNFAKELIPFGYAMVNFSRIVSGNIDSKAVESAANAGKIMAEMADKLPNSGGLIDSIIGSNDMDKFGAQLVPFGNAMVNFSRIVAGKIDSEAVTAAANAGKMMAEMADTIPNTGGVVAAFTGHNDMDLFGDQLVPFGYAMVRFSDIVAGRIDNDAVTAAASAGKTLVELANTVPNTGGVVSWFTGHNDMDLFGDQLVPFGEAMVEFSDTISGNIDTKAIAAAATAGAIMVKLAEAMPESNNNDMWGIFGWLAGGSEGNMEAFGDQMVSFGKSIVKLSNSIEGINPASITGFVNAVKSIVSLNNSLPETLNMSSIEESLTELGDAMITFSRQLSGNIDSTAIKSVSETGKNLATMAKEMPDEVDLSRITNGLNNFGNAMVEFSSNVSGEFEYENVKEAIEAGKLLAGLTNDIPKDVNLRGFAFGIIDVGSALSDFASSISDKIDQGTVEEAAKAGEAIADMMEAIPQNIYTEKYMNSAVGVGNTITSFYFAIRDVDKGKIIEATDAGDAINRFMNGLPTIIEADRFIDCVYGTAEAIKTFYLTIKDGVDKQQVIDATDAGHAIIGFMNALPTMVDVSPFQMSVMSAGRAICNFADEINDTVDQEKIESATAAGLAIVDFMNNLPTTLKAEPFKINAGSLASAINTFYYTLTKDLNQDTIIGATTAGTAITDFMKKLPESVNAEPFKNNVVSISEAIKTFYFSVKENIDLATIQIATDAGDDIISFMNNLPTEVNADVFKNNVVGVAKAIAGFSTEVKEKVDSSAVDTATSMGNKIIDMIDTIPTGTATDFISNVNSVKEAITSFATDMSSVAMPDLTTISDSLGSLASSGITSFLDKFSNAEADAKTAGTDLFNSLLKGIEDNTSKIKDTFVDATSDAITGVRAKRQGFYDAGSYLVNGLVNGINANKYKVSSAARDMAENAVIAAERRLDINSPSKEFYRIGNYSGLGFVNALGDYSNRSYEAGSDMANSAKTGLSDAISKVRDYLDSDMDMQPTIRPVLDLSNVRTGVGSIGNMLNIGSSVDVLSNVRSINTMMNRNNQNGRNDDVVSAINKLRKDVDNLNGTTYQINGVTYDDGSNISSAVESIVRAAKIGRRV